MTRRVAILALAAPLALASHAKLARAQEIVVNLGFED